jgi:hypothetical protein
MCQCADPCLLHAPAWCPASVLQIKVNAFRIAEAKEVLQQLGLPRHGRKDELSARILSMFQDAATL